ncbi:MAG: YjbF family lipoprotein [Jannaschia sp.]
MILKSIFACCLTGLVLAGCSGGTGSDANRPKSGFGQTAITAIGSLFGASPPVVDARSVLTAQFVEQVQTPLILIVAQRLDSALTMIPLSQNGETVQWRDAVGGGLFRRNGILVGTRGAGHDLLSADVEPLRAALRAGGGRDVTRINRILNGENQVVAEQYICDVRATGDETLTFYGKSYETTRFVEACRGDGPAFENRYWIDRGGVIRRSLERVSPQVGFLLLDVLAD